MVKEGELISFAESVQNTFNEDEYGGLYINDSQELIINVTSYDTQKKFMSFIKNKTGKENFTETIKDNYTYIEVSGYGDVKLKCVKYTLTELKAAMDLLVNDMQELGLKAVYLDEFDNCVKITVSKVTSEIQKKVFSRVDLKYLVFEESAEDLSFLALEKRPTHRE